jgi:hypothetical protein
LKSIAKSQVLEVLKQEARNSGHFVWLLADLTFIESSEGWIFAFKKVRHHFCFALEPLIPGVKDYESISEESLQKNLLELFIFTESGICSFTAIGLGFSEKIKGFGFQFLKIGREPWMDLANYFPTGNSGKGVRAARNQAIRSGTWIEEWSGFSLNQDMSKKSDLEHIFKSWSQSTVLQIKGFLLASDPFAFSDERKYFVARSPRRIEGYLIASPIYKNNSYYFEDLILLPDAARGCSELLLLEAMESLKQKGAKDVSLGIVGLKNIDWITGPTPPTAIKTGIEWGQRVMPLFYNSSGIETFRKRFKPYLWTDVFLAVRPVAEMKSGATLQWCSSLLAIFYCLNIQFVLRPKNMALKFFPFFKKHSLSIFWGLLTLTSHLLISHGKEMSEDISNSFAFPLTNFSLSVLYQTITSDFLFQSENHFYSLYFIGIFTFYHLEKKIKIRTLWIIFITISFFDDFINLILLSLPINLHKTFILNSKSAVGSSYIIVAFIGLLTQQSKVLREKILALICLFITTFFIIISQGIDGLLLNLSHLPFFGMGYLIGIFRHYRQQQMSRRMAKGKSPEAKKTLIKN